MIAVCGVAMEPSALLAAAVSPRLRLALVSTAIGFLSIWLGWQVANESYGWPLLALGVTAAAVLVRLTKLPFDVIMVGLVLFGYIVGNRGFAQQSLIPGLPLFPAETTLFIAGAWWLVAHAFERRLPWNSDALNWCVLLWIIAGSARLLFDIHDFGFLAIRDYAMVYYALFFFVAQRMARSREAYGYLIGCLLVGTAVLLPLLPIYDSFPDFFLRRLVVMGAPLVYFKGDLANTFVGVGALMIFFWAKDRQRYWAWPMTSLLFVYAVTGGNRASMLGVVVATLLLIAARRWSFPAWQASATVVAAVIVIGLAVVADNTWAEGKIAGLQDRVRSVADVKGQSTYLSEDSFNKGDNNRFRYVWWASVIRETWQGNPAFGLGFGYDLAHSFIQEYSPEMSEEFTVRSPHSVFLSVFGRMGLTGLAIWVAFCGVLLQRTWRALRRNDARTEWGLWCSAWVMLVSASFGVVLEGPMGAVPFWAVLGLAHGSATVRSTAGKATTDEVAVTVEPTVNLTASLHAEHPGV